MIEVKNIVKTYARSRVLDDISAEIETGKITSFIGPNGAGKTTLLGVISRLIKPDSGSVSIDGRQLSDYDPAELAKRLSILKQSNSINISLTVRDLVGFGRFPHSAGRLTAEDRETVDRALDYLDLTSIAENDINQLSGGQRQRAFIAMIVAQDTEHVLLDEPLNSLDMRHSAEMMKILRRLTDDLQKTVVLVLHDVNFAASYSDNIVAIKNGKIAAAGSVDDVITESVLSEVFEMPLTITEHVGKKMCIYY